MTEIRLLHKEEYREAARLSDLVFGASGKPPMAKSFPYVFAPSLNQGFGAFEDGQLAAFMGLVPSVLRIEDARIQAYSLGSVCTHSDHRGKGLASRMLAKVKDHVAEAGASLLFVSGDRSLYRRMGCFPFGSFKRLTMNEANVPKFENSAKADGFEFREQRPTDWLKLKKLADGRLDAFEQSLWDLAGLIDAEGYADQIGRKHKVMVAERNNELVGFLVVGVPQLDGENAVVIERSGGVDAIQGLLKEACRRYGTVEMLIRFDEKHLLSALDQAEQRPEKNEGTVCVVKPDALIEQLRPYMMNKNAERFENIHLQRIENGGVEIYLSDEKAVLSPQEFVSFIFDENVEWRQMHSVCQKLREAFFPMPCPYMAGLNYV